MEENRVTILIKQLFTYLNNSVKYAVLRNYEGLPDNNMARDIDIITTKSELRKHKSALVHIIEKNNWKIIGYYNSDKHCALYIGSCFDEEDIHVVQLDFLFNTSIFGVLFLDADEFLKDRRFNGKVYHVSIEYVFLDKYLYNRSLGSSYPEKYIDIKNAVKDSPVVLEKLRSLFNTSSVEETDYSHKMSLINNAIKYNLRHRFFAFMKDWLCFIVSYIRNFIKTDAVFSIGFTGPDGSGKTTVLEILKDRLESVYKIVLFHFRPMLFGNLGELAHSVGVVKTVDRDYNNPHRGGKTNTFSSLCRIVYYSIDYTLGYWTKIKKIKKQRHLVFFDRYYTDIIVDSRRLRVFLNHKCLYWFGKIFVPALDYNILLTADEKMILSRKQELDAVGIRRINEKMEFLATKKGYKLVWNNGTVQEAVVEILAYIFEEQHKKNLKKIKF